MRKGGPGPLEGEGGGGGGRGVDGMSKSDHVEGNHVKFMTNRENIICIEYCKL
jgi:hypothetical protein